MLWSLKPKAGVLGRSRASGTGDRLLDWGGQLQLLIFQPTPFCNLDCDYCYLPDRDNTHRMDLATLDTAAYKIFAAGLPQSELAVVWHAGEPLAVPCAWYQSAFERLQHHCPPSVKLTHNFQTNAVLIDDHWVDFLQSHEVRVGISLDGPAHLHDRHRRTRDGRGTHAQAMRGVEALREAGYPFHVICVLTRDSLSYPDEIFDFFSDLGPVQLCLNIEEIEAAHGLSSLAENVAETERAYRAFMMRLVERLRFTDSESSLTRPERRMRIREIDDVLLALRNPNFGRFDGNSQNIPGQILSVAWDGSFGTGSPELLGLLAPGYGSLALGNVLTDSLPPVEVNDYARYWDAIRQGVDRCHASCAYFDFCRGGAPANKLGELGRFDTTETLFCRLTQKILIDIVLDALDRDLLTV